MMKMDGRDSTECQNWEKRDIMVILEFDLSHKMTKFIIVTIFSNCEEKKTWGVGDFRSSGHFCFVFRERTSSFSLYLQTI